MVAVDWRFCWNYEIQNRVNLFVEPTLPHDESLSIEKGEMRVFLCMGDREPRLIEAEDKPVLQFRHGDFPAAKLTEHTGANLGVIKNLESGTENLVADDHILAMEFEPFCDGAHLLNAVRFVSDRHEH